MNHGKRVFQRLVFLLAGLLVVGLTACGEYPGVPRKGMQSAQGVQSAPAVQPAQSSQQESTSPEEPAPAAEETEMEDSGEEGGSDMAKTLHELEEVKMEDVELTTGTINVELRDFEFDPPVLHVKAGKVTFFFENASTHAHNYRIAAWDDHESIVFKGPKIGARKKREMDIDLEPGTYYVLCNLSDHEERGMVGKLFVEP